MGDKNHIFQTNATKAKKVAEMDYMSYLWKYLDGKANINDIVEREFDKQVWDKIPQRIKDKINTYYTKNNCKKRVMKYVTFWAIKNMVERYEELLFDEHAEIVLTERGTRMNTLKVVTGVNENTGVKYNIVRIFSNQRYPRIMNYYVQLNAFHKNFTKRVFNTEDYGNKSYMDLKEMKYVRR